MRIAYFSPLNPVKSGIADYSEELLPYLAQHAQIDIFVDTDVATYPSSVKGLDVFDYHLLDRLATNRRYDICLYHMGNSLHHEYIYCTLRRRPGVTVLHEAVIHNFIAMRTLKRGNLGGYVREMGYAYGKEGVQAARSVLFGTEVDSLTTAYPLTARVIDSSLGVIVHSKFVGQQVSAYSPQMQVAKVNHHSVHTPTGPSPEMSRRELGIAPEQFVVVTLGFITFTKRIGVVLRAFARLRALHPDALYVLVGEMPSWCDVRPIIEELALEEAVRLTGYVPLEDYYRYLRAADVCVNLRYPTMGATSGSVLRAMAAGKAVIVSDIGWFSELPDGTCAKVDVGPSEEDTLVAYLEFLIGNPDVRQKLGDGARAYVEREHAIEDSTAAYIQFIQQVLASPR
jgi:glycosyltransferase involved in cell wall biosynthesis